MSIVQIIGWLNVIAFLFVIILLTMKKRNRMAGRVNYQDILENSQITQYKYFKWLNPFSRGSKSRFTAKINMVSYWIYVVLGIGISLAFVIFVLQFYVLIPATLVAGLAVPSIVVFYRKRKQREYIYDCLSEYVNATANLAMTFGEPINALRELIDKEYVQEPIMTDVRTVLLSVDNGMSLEKALNNFENHYENNPYLQFFHQNLAMQSELGGKMNDVIMDTVHDFDNALGLRITSRNEKRIAHADFYKMLAMIGAVPLILMGFSYDYYQMFVESLIGKTVFAGIILIGIISALQVEKTYDKETFFTKKIK